MEPNSLCRAPIKRKPSFILCVVSSCFICTSIGINSVIFPLTMEGQGLGSFVIGAVLSVETITAIAVCLGLSKLIKKCGLKVCLITSGAVPAIPLLALSASTPNLALWALSIFAIGVGTVTYLLISQIWVDQLAIKERKGLMLGLYFTCLSLGMAAGPLIINQIDAIALMLNGLKDIIRAPSEEVFATRLPFLLSAACIWLAVGCILIGLRHVPDVKLESVTKLFPIIKKSSTMMFAIAMAGAVFYGITSFIAIYGIRNNLEMSEVALLLTCFTLGALLSDAPVSWLSDVFDRRYVLMVLILISVGCTIYLPISIYHPKQAYLLLLIWGGVIAAIYTISLASITEQHEGSELVAANSAYNLMENFGGSIGTIAIGASMTYFGVDGLPYGLTFVSILYFCYALTRYKVV